MSKKYEKKEKPQNKQSIKKDSKKSGPKRSLLDEEGYDIDREDDY